MQKLKELNLQDIHFQIMFYVEYEQRRKLFKYVMTQLSAAVQQTPSIGSLQYCLNSKLRALNYPYYNEIIPVHAFKDQINFVFWAQADNKYMHRPSMDYKRDPKYKYRHNSILPNFREFFCNMSWKNAAKVGKLMIQKNLSLLRAKYFLGSLQNIYV